MKTVKDLKAFLDGLPDDALIASYSFMGEPRTSVIIPIKDGYECKQINCPVLSPYKDFLEQLK